MSSVIGNFYRPPAAQGTGPRKEVGMRKFENENTEGGSRNIEAEGRGGHGTERIDSTNVKLCTLR